jgi:hypothetical protein
MNQERSGMPIRLKWKLSFRGLTPSGTFDSLFTSINKLEHSSNIIAEELH